MTAVDTPHPRRHGKLVGRIMVYGLLAVLALAFLAPLATMLLTSLMPDCNLSAFTRF